MFLDVNTETGEFYPALSDADREAVRRASIVMMVMAKVGFVSSHVSDKLTEFSSKYCQEPEPEEEGDA